MPTPEPQTEHFSIPAGASKADIFTLRSDQIAEHWPQIVKFLVMIDDPDWIPEQVYQYLISAKAQLWGMADDEQMTGIWVTRIDECATAKFGLVWIAAGKGLEEGVPRFLECTEPWFREKKCEYIEIRGRKGWARVLPGFKQTSVILRKVL